MTLISNIEGVLASLSVQTISQNVFPVELTVTNVPAYTSVCFYPDIQNFSLPEVGDGTFAERPVELLPKQGIVTYRFDTTIGKRFGIAIADTAGKPVLAVNASFAEGELCIHRSPSSFPQNDVPELPLEWKVMLD